MNLSGLKRTVNLFIRGVNHLLWPAVCVNCSQNICETDNNLCQNCWDQLLVATAGSYCPKCGRDITEYAILNGTCPDCRENNFHFDNIARSGLYSDCLRRMIISFKSGRTELALTLEPLANAALQASPFFNHLDFFVPVPLHFSRRIARGYNQSHILAKKLEHPSAKLSTDLVKIRRTKFQTEMTSPKKRAANVAGAFAVRAGHKLADRNVCLIDDIKTSGATLSECAKTLKEAGVKKVFALVLAVAGQDKA